MQIYKFTFDTVKMGTRREVIEVKKKDSLYEQKLLGTCHAFYIHKDDIGKCLGSVQVKIYLLEDDYKKAKAIFIEELELRINSYENCILDLAGAISDCKKFREMLL